MNKLFTKYRNNKLKPMINKNQLSGDRDLFYNEHGFVRNVLRNIEPKTNINPYLLPKIVSPTLPIRDDRQLAVMEMLLENSDKFTSTFALKRGLVGTSTSVGTTATMVLQSRFLRGYILSNPTVSTGKATTGTLLASASRATGSGTTTTSPIDVSDYKEIKLYLDISANAGLDTIQIDALTRDPVSGNWANSQTDIFISPSAVGTYYENLGSLGVDENFAIRWTVTNVGGGDPTFSLSYVVKDASAAFSLSNTIYIGGSGVTTVSGYPLLEGHELRFFLEPNVELWAISPVSSGLDLKIFELQ